MKWSWAVLGVTAERSTLGMALAAIFLVTGCNDYGNTFQNPTGASLSVISPSGVPAGSPQFTLTVTGGGFVAKTVVQWNGNTIQTVVSTNSSGNVTGVTATVPASLVAKPGTAFVNTLNPASGKGTNGLSNVLSFTIGPVANPLPTISSLSPASAAAGSASFALAISGSSFLPASDPSGGSQVHWNSGSTQSTLTIVSISSTQIQATVDTSLLVNSTSQAVTATVTVYNPPSSSSAGGGGSSLSLPFSITPAGTGMIAPAHAVAEETPAVSVDGRYVAYTAAQNDHSQIFVRDTCEGATTTCQARTLVLSTATDGVAGNDDSHSPSISSDGRYVAFSSAATNLVAGAPAGRQVYLRDTCFGAGSGSCTPSTQLVSTDANGTLVGTEGILPSVSSSGRFVAFLAVTASHTASKSKAAAGGPNSGYRQVFVRDTCLGAANCAPKTTRISLQPGDESTTEAKPAGPALSGSASRVALPAANAPTLFTRSVAVDDRVFLALVGNQH